MNRKPAAFNIEKSSGRIVGRKAYFRASRNGDASPKVRKWTRMSSSTEYVAWNRCWRQAARVSGGTDEWSKNGLYGSDRKEVPGG